MSGSSYRRLGFPLVNFDWGHRTYVMGVINVTPDSFSGDGLGDDADGAVALAVRMAEDGADLIDVGGMSSRPGHQEIPDQEELRRVMSVLPRVAATAQVPVSVDTYRYSVAEAAVQSGATIINDIWGLKREPRLAELAAREGCMLVLMHNQVGTDYQDLVAEVVASLGRSVMVAEAAGVPREQLVIDPGIGFGKTAEQNLEVLRRLDELKVLSLPILLGTSRKSTIGKVLGLPVEDRLEGTAATVALGIAAGADIVRVHDVAPMVRVARMADAIVRGEWREAGVEA
jgi:dihydropteroate synthase